MIKRDTSFESDVAYNCLLYTNVPNKFGSRQKLAPKINRLPHFTLKHRATGNINYTRACAAAPQGCQVGVKIPAQRLIKLAQK